VESIGIAPDGELIEVRMNIDVKAGKALKRDPTLRATLELSGITGLRYIEIDRRSGDALNQAPVLSFKPPSEVIPSARSSFKAIQNALGDVYDRFMQLDVAGISNDARTALQAANQLLRDERVDALLTNFKTASQSSSAVLKNLENMTAGVKLAPAVENATQATEQAKALFSELTTGTTGKQITGAVEQVTRLLQAAQQVTADLHYSLQRFDRTTDNLQSLSEEVRNQPSLLLFSAPPGSHRPEDQDSK
jgi:phospholipid/cholesterol/gamma-HCH transport system substrate-binding protein